MDHSRIRGCCGRGASRAEADLSQGNAPLDAQPLFERLAHYRIRYVLHGSVAAATYGLAVTPGDLDMVPDQSVGNLRRIGDLLVELGARPKLIPRSKWPKALSRAECEQWKPEPLTVEQLDHRFVTPYGELDVVPALAGLYVDLIRNAHPVTAFGCHFHVADFADLTRVLFAADRARDADRIGRLREIKTHHTSGSQPTDVEKRLRNLGTPE